MFRNSCAPPAVMLLAWSLLLLIGGCASTPLTGGLARRPAYEDFLSQPQRLRPVANESGALVWVDPGVDLARYRIFLIEPIQVRLAEDAAHKTVDPAELKALADYLREALVKALTPTYKVVSQPGPGVLKMRVAITDLVPTKPQYSVAALVIPYATVADIASGPVSGAPAGSTAYLGRTGIAGMLIDARTQQVVAEYADTRVGRKYVLDTNDGLRGAVTAGVGNYLKSYSNWAYARQAFDGWAGDLRRWLDSIHGRSN
jgi:hypothetical protein